MKIMVFLHGNIIMHGTAVGKSRKQRVEQVVEKSESIYEFESYVPIGNAVEKLKTWQKQGAEIMYFSCHRTQEGIDKKDRPVLKKYDFPEGQIVFQSTKQEYNEIIDKIRPDILIEDDCESIGGKSVMISTSLTPETLDRMTIITTKEFGGIDYLPDEISMLKNY